MADIHQNDIGVMFKLTVKDQDGSVVVLGDSHSITVTFLRPDKTVSSKTALLFSDGTDGVVKYTTVSGDLNQAGRWQLQAIVSQTDDEDAVISRFHSDAVKFKVLPNLE